MQNSSWMTGDSKVKQPFENDIIQCCEKIKVSIMWFPMRPETI